jgi:hypothetical protein
MSTFTNLQITKTFVKVQAKVNVILFDGSPLRWSEGFRQLPKYTNSINKRLLRHKRNNL